MPITEYENYGGRYNWYWEEAFAKFGFGDGDGPVQTWRVEEALRQGGYEPHSSDWGMHNTVIQCIFKDGADLIPHRHIQFGYDNPRDYLPREIIALLDAAFPSRGDVTELGLF
jgi:hypothetical protein